jgi:hypothetical protein
MANNESSNSARYPFLVPGSLLLCLLLSLFMVSTTQPPTATDITAEGFSSARAEALLREFLGDETPHPVATTANRQVKQRILQQLERFGIAAQEQTTFACNSGKRGRHLCAQVENIIARIPGENPEALLLMAHYDSVPHAPGAGDDGAGVAAVLEVARQLSLEGPHRNTLLLAITDGEEVGLVGAEAFFGQHPAASDVAFVLNLEGSGSSGPVQLLRTGRDNRFAIQQYQAAVTDSMANSVANEIFKHMPNDTDFSVAQRAGLQGIDLAFAGERNHYHTALDSVDNLDKDTLQHHGNLLLPLARELLQADLKNTPSGDVVYFDQYGQWTVYWGEDWSLLLTGTAGLLLILAIRRRSSTAEVARSCARVLLAFVAVSASLAAIFYLLNKMVELPAWPATQWPLLCLLYSATLAIGLRFPAEMRFWPVLYANVLLWTLLAAVTALFAPGAVVMFLPVLLQLAVLVWVASMMTDSQRLRDIVALLALLAITPTTVAFVPLLLDTQGYQLVAAVIPNLSLFGCMLLCLNSGRERPYSRQLWQIFALAALALLLVIPNLDMYSPWRPQHVVLTYLEDRSAGTAHWLAQSREKISEPLRKAGSLADSDDPVAPYFDKNPGPVTTAAITDTPAPRLQVVSDQWVDGVRSVHLQLQSLRGERQLMLRVAASSGLTEATINGEPLALEVSELDQGELGEHYALAAITSDPGGVTFLMQFDNSGPQTLYYEDASNELPPTGKELKAARHPLATPVHRGDQWLIADRLLLPALAVY